MRCHIICFTFGHWTISVSTIWPYRIREWGSFEIFPTTTTPFEGEKTMPFVETILAPKWYRNASASTVCLILCYWKYVQNTKINIWKICVIVSKHKTNYHFLSGKNFYNIYNSFYKYTYTRKDNKIYLILKIPHHRNVNEYVFIIAIIIIIIIIIIL